MKGSGEATMTWEQAGEAAKPVLKCLLCRSCGLVLQFSAGRGIFDFD